MSATGRLVSVDGSADNTTTDNATTENAAAAGAAHSDPPADWQSVMIDVSDLSLADLAARSADEDSTLARALRRLADDLAEPGRPIAGFNSAV
jgi:FXSXX-COOH protein